MSDSDRPRQVPKGGRKGGTQFPQVALKKAAEYAKRLVSKTHTGAQPAEVILKGVFDHAGSDGKIRASALKQYGLLEGTPNAYEASDRAKKLVAAPEGEATKYLQEAFLDAKVFKKLYDTFVTDTVSRAKIRQQAAGLDVHPDSLDKATQLFIESAEFSDLAKVDGDNVTVLRPDASTTVTLPAAEEVGAGADARDDDEEAEATDGEAGETADDDSDERPPRGAIRAAPRVTFNVDSSMDTDKLEKQLKLLRKYGVI